MTWLITATSIAAIAAGYLWAGPVWLFALATGYWLPVCARSPVNETLMGALEQQRIGRAAVALMWSYVAALIGVSISFALGRGIAVLVS